MQTLIIASDLGCGFQVKTLKTMLEVLEVMWVVRKDLAVVTILWYDNAGVLVANWHRIGLWGHENDWEEAVYADIPGSAKIKQFTAK